MQRSLILGEDGNALPKTIRVNANGELRAEVVSGDVTVDGYTGMLDEDGVAYGVKQVDGKPRVSSVPYAYDIAEGLVTGHVPWNSFGYTPTMNATKSDLWSKAGLYVYPTSAQQMEMYSSDNAQDIGTIIKGDATGNTVQSDATGTTTTLDDLDVDFTAATAVAVGDHLILDPHAAHPGPEYGVITNVAEHRLTVARGFQKGGSGASRYYAVIDKSAYTGAQAVWIQHLDGDYTKHGEIVVLNGTTPVNTVNTNIFRINSVRVIAAGSGNVPVGNLSLRNTAGAITYGYITLGYTVDRSSFYTVPDGYTLYVTQVTFGFGCSNANRQYARLHVHSNRDPTRDYLVSDLRYPETEAIAANESVPLVFTVPLKFFEHTELSAAGDSTIEGIAFVTMRGWLEAD